MAEEAFALSPINARPNVPGEADYEAIREAFMETARGRWFLAEYTKRNRNADTNLLLEAVSRLEGNLAAQKQPQGLSLTAALGAIRAAVRQAKATAIEVLPRSEGDTVQTSARNGVRIIREIAMTMRECGADTRICDLLDTQVKAIETGHAALQLDSREAVLASYDALMERIETLADRSHAPAAKADAPTVEQALEPREASVTPLFKAPTNEHVVEAAAETAHAPKHAFSPAPVEEALAAAEALAEAAEAMAHNPSLIPDEATAPHDVDVEAEEAEDLAVLDVVAMEMGAIDLDETDELFDPIPEPVASEPVHQAPAAPARAADEMTLAEIAQVALAPELPTAAAPSLGAALIANGVIGNPKASRSDPLAPIRRMTQAEKIAFFS